MSSPAIAQPPESDADLEFYGIRDDFARAYQPATAEERFLVTNITQCWLLLQDMHQLRRHLAVQKGMLGLLEEDKEKYRMVMRNLIDADRMWRHAVAEFRRARRRNTTRPGSLRAIYENAAVGRPQPEPQPEPTPVRNEVDRPRDDALPHESSPHQSTDQSAAHIKPDPVATPVEQAVRPATTLSAASPLDRPKHRDPHIGITEPLSQAVRSPATTVKTP